LKIEFEQERTKESTFMQNFTSAKDYEEFCQHYSSIFGEEAEERNDIVVWYVSTGRESLLMSI
jgi:hypothetical protein